MNRPFVRTISAWLCAAAVCSTAHLADAYLTYPAIVQSKLQLNDLPDCPVCHRDNQTEAAATATKAFANELKSLGLPKDKYSSAAEGLLRTALQHVIDCNIDSDGDGVSDVEELRAGTDLNDGPGPVIDECLNPPPPPNGGAGAGGASGEDGATTFAGFSQSCYGVKTYKGPPAEHGCSLGGGMSSHFGSAWLVAAAATVGLLGVARRRRGNAYK